MSKKPRQMHKSHRVARPKAVSPTPDPCARVVTSAEAEFLGYYDIAQGQTVTRYDVWRGWVNANE